MFRVQVIKTLFAKGQVLRNRLALVIFFYTVVMSVVTILRHHSLFSHAWDLGIFNQVFWSTVHGRFFYYTVEPWFGQCFFAVHFSPILIFIVPIYAIWPHPETLLVLQSFIIALGVVPLYLLAKDKLGERLAFILSLSYLTNPLILGANLFDFHFEAFMPITLLATVYFLRKRNLKFYSLSLLLSLMVHEYMAFLMVLIILFETIMEIKAKEKLRKIAPYVILTVSSSILWLFLASTVHSYLRQPETQSMTVLAPLLEDVSRPLQLFNYLGYNALLKLLYLTLLLAPLLFTPLFSPYISLSVPWLLFIFMLNYSPYYEVGYQYSLVIVPFVYLSSIEGIKRLLRLKPSRIHVFSRLLLFLALASLVIGVARIQPIVLNTEKTNAAHEIVLLIPENASVLATNNLFPHISNRFDAWILPFSYDEPYPMHYTGISNVWKEYALSILSENDPDVVLLDLRTEDAQNMKLIASELLARSSYGTYAYAEDILLLRRDYRNEPLIFVPLKSSFNYETLALYDGSIIAETASKNGKVLVHTTENLSNVTFWGGPDYAVPSGRYEVIFRLRLTGASQDVSVVTLAITADRGATLLNSTVLDVGDFKGSGTWEEFTLNFQTELPLSVEFKGVQVNNAVNLYLDYIRVVQLDPRIS